MESLTISTPLQLRRLLFHLINFDGVSNTCTCVAVDHHWNRAIFYKCQIETKCEQFIYTKYTNSEKEKDPRLADWEKNHAGFVLMFFIAAISHSITFFIAFVVDLYYLRLRNSFYHFRILLIILVIIYDHHCPLSFRYVRHVTRCFSSPIAYCLHSSLSIYNVWLGNTHHSLEMLQSALHCHWNEDILIFITI